MVKILNIMKVLCEITNEYKPFSKILDELLIDQTISRSTVFSAMKFLKNENFIITKSGDDKTTRLIKLNPKKRSDGDNLYKVIQNAKNENRERHNKRVQQWQDKNN